MKKTEDRRTPFQKLTDLTKRVISVPKAEARKQEKRKREKKAASS